MNYIVSKQSISLAIYGGKSLNKLCNENNFPAEKEKEVLSTKFRNILSLYLWSLWDSIKIINNIIWYYLKDKIWKFLEKVKFFWVLKSWDLGQKK